MNRLVLGTASLGSRVGAAESDAVIRAAFDAGITRIDTAPLYGAGYAPNLVARCAGTGTRVSTKFASPWEPALRFTAKRLVGVRGLRDLISWPPVHAEEDREQIEWWDAPTQAGWMKMAAAAVGPRVEREFLFLHSPPVLLPEPVLARLAAHAESLGFGLGLCSPRTADLEQWLDLAPTCMKCVQLHLDAAMPRAGRLARMAANVEVWVHGIYSPPSESGDSARAQRERWCIGFGRDRPQFAAVAGCKHPAGIGRLADFAALLG